MTQSNKSPVVAWLLWALLAFAGAHRLYLGVSGWWYYPTAIAAAISGLVVGIGSLASLIHLGLMVLWVYDAAHISRWLAGGDK